MERERFDQLTRLIASRSSRREVLKLLVGGIAAGAFGPSIRSTAQAQVVDCVPACGVGLECISGVCGIIETCLEVTEFCETADECCGDLGCALTGRDEPTCCFLLGNPCDGGDCCGDPTCGDDFSCCLQEGGACSIADDCCAGLECLTGFCVTGQTCITEGVECDPGNDQCCLNLECTDLGQGPVCFECIPEGDPCETVGCCEGLVCNEFMTACVPICLPEGEKCSKDDDCCDGLACDTKGICVGVCGLGGDPCQMVAGSCCEPFTCFEGICDIPKGCVDKGLRCAKDFPCCDKELCVNGICGGKKDDGDPGGEPDKPEEVGSVDTLPGTGTGDSAGDSASWIAGAALAGGAAAIGAKLLKETQTES